MKLLEITGLVLIMFLLVVMVKAKSSNADEWVDIVDDTRITNHDYGSQSPRLVVDSNGSVHVIWVDFRHGLIPELYYKKLDNNGNVIIGDQRVTNANTASLRAGTIALDSLGNVHLAWNDGRTLGNEIYYKKLDNNGNALTGDIKISNLDGCIRADIAVDSSNNIHIAWEDQGAGNTFEIYYTKLNNDGVTLVEDTVIPTPFSAYSRFPRIALGNSDNIFIAWTDSSTGQPLSMGGLAEIHYSKLIIDQFNQVVIIRDNIPTIVGANFSVNDIAVDSLDDLHMIFHNANYSYAKLNSTGELINVYPISNTPGTANIFDMVVDSSNNINVIWQDTQHGDNEIYFTKFRIDENNELETIVVEKRLTTYNSDSSGPQLVVDGSDNIHIVWNDNRDNVSIPGGRFSIYYTKGSLRSEPITLTAIDQGHYRADGGHDAESDSALTVTGSHQDDGRSFFVFDLSSISNNITGATLNFFPPGAGTCNPCNNPTVDFLISAVSTPYSTLTANHSDASGIPIFSDLGSGTPYGTFSDNPYIVEPSHSISLSPSAIADMNQTVGYFAVGVKVADPNVIWDGLTIGDSNSFATLDLQLSTLGNDGSSLSFTRLNVPDSSYTAASGINDTEQIVGNYFEEQTLGFLYSGGTYTTINPPGSKATFANDVNNSGDIVGYYNNIGDQFIGTQGFLFSGGTYTTLSFPNAISTKIFGLNDSGQIVGQYFDTNNNGHGFLYDNGSWTTLDFPGGTVSTNGTSALGIDSTGTIVGAWHDSTHMRGFSYDGSNYTSINDRSASNEIKDVNDSGFMVGYSRPGSGGLQHALTYDGTSFSTFSIIPGSDHASASGVNNFGRIVGNYRDGIRIYGFVTPAIDVDDDGFSPPEDCDDDDNTVNPDAPELCDGIDNNCDGNIDEGIGATYYGDQDGDDYGNPTNVTQGCVRPAGYVVDNTDCDDTDSDRFPGNPEVCDGKDNDCDGVVDNGVKTTFYQDLDSDGFGNALVTQDACSAPAGFVADDTDCDDTDPDKFPGNHEVCDGKDNDCDGVVDNGVKTTFYQDLDSDGFGDTLVTQDACSAPAGFVADNMDCDDTDPTIFTGAPELCDRKDNDCDGVVPADEVDDDGDGITECEGDCDDTDAATYPGATDIPENGIDEDCNGSDLTWAVQIGTTIDVINSLDPGVFDKPKDQDKLAKEVEKVFKEIEKGKEKHAIHAIKKLENILEEMDGCALRGQPDTKDKKKKKDKEDSIQDCDAQAQVYPLVLDAIPFLSQP